MLITSRANRAARPIRPSAIAPAAVAIARIGAFRISDGSIGLSIADFQGDTEKRQVLEPSGRTPAGRQQQPTLRGTPGRGRPPLAIEAILPRLRAVSTGRVGWASCRVDPGLSPKT